VSALKRTQSPSARAEPAGAAGAAPALLGLRLRNGLDVSAEILPWHDLLDRIQRIVLAAQREFAQVAADVRDRSSFGS
jgi:hypothetical protein